MKFEIIVFLMLIQIFLLYVIASILYKILELVKPTPQTGIVRGAVTYGDPTMVGDVVVTLINSNGEIVFSASTTTEGTFEFDEVAIGDYTVRAHKDVEEGYLGGEAYVSVMGGDERIVDLPLVRRLWSDAL